MRRIIFSASVLIILALTVCSYAGEVKLTTYYPTPFASYNRTLIRCLGVGDNNDDGVVNINDAPDPALAAQLDTAWVANNVSIGPAFKTSPKARFQVANGNVLIQNPPAGIIINVPYYNSSTFTGTWDRSIKFSDWNLSSNPSNWTNTTLGMGIVGSNQNYTYGYITSNNNMSMSFAPNGDVSVGRIGASSKFHVQGGSSLFAGGTNNSSADTLRIKHSPSYFGANEDAVIIEKTDNNQTVAGGMVFGFSRSNANNTLVNDTGWAVNDTAIMALRGNGTGGNVGIGTTNPHLPAPNSQNANLDVNDVWVRSANYGAGQWMSQMSGIRFVYGTAAPQSLISITSYIKDWGEPPYTGYCDPNLYLDVDVHTGDLIKVVIMGSASGKFYSYIVGSINESLLLMTHDPVNGEHTHGTLVSTTLSGEWASFTMNSIYRAVDNGTVRFQQFYFANDFAGTDWGEVAGRVMYAEVRTNQ